MNTVAKLIIDKLNAIESRLERLEANMDSTAWLNEPVPEKTAIVKTRKPRKPRASSKQSKHLPPAVAKRLMEDHELAESTRNTYANTLRRLLENDQMIPVLVDKRNEGMLYEDIAELPLMEKYSRKRLQNMVSVGLRYGVIERTENGRYQVGCIN